MKLENPTELRDILHEKNDLIVRQTRRIKLLEDKLTEIRQKYMYLKVSNQMFKS
jgi:hypothetical protein